MNGFDFVLSTFVLPVNIEFSLSKMSPDLWSNVFLYQPAPIAKYNEPSELFNALGKPSVVTGYSVLDNTVEPDVVTNL